MHTVRRAYSDYHFTSREGSWKYEIIGHSWHMIWVGFCKQNNRFSVNGLPIATSRQSILNLQQSELSDEASLVCPQISLLGDQLSQFVRRGYCNVLTSLGQFLFFGAFLVSRCDFVHLHDLFECKYNTNWLFNIFNWSIMLNEVLIIYCSQYIKTLPGLLVLGLRNPFLNDTAIKIHISFLF